MSNTATCADLYLPHILLCRAVCEPDHQQRIATDESDGLVIQSADRDGNYVKSFQTCHVELLKPR